MCGLCECVSLRCRKLLKSYTMSSAVLHASSSPASVSCSARNESDCTAVQCGGTGAVQCGATGDWYLLGGSESGRNQGGCVLKVFLFPAHYNHLNSLTHKM